ncbi:hypothetical protein L9F63_003577, partial [Diploptera punctata]
AIVLKCGVDTRPILAEISQYCLLCATLIFYPRCCSSESRKKWDLLARARKIEILGGLSYVLGSNRDLVFLVNTVGLGSSDLECPWITVSRNTNSQYFDIVTSLTNKKYYKRVKTCTH